MIGVNCSDIADWVIRGGLERFRADGETAYRPEPWFMPLYRYSHSFRAVLHLILGYDYTFNSPWNREQNIAKALADLKNVLTTMNTYCIQNQINFSVIIHPIPQEYYKTLDHNVDFIRIDELVPMLNADGVKVASLRSSFEAKWKSPEAWKAVSWPIDGHFNAKGYRVMAEEISKQLN